MKHGGVHSKSYSSNNEKGKDELLSFICCGSTGSVYLGSSHGNFSVLGISSLNTFASILYIRRGYEHEVLNNLLFI